MLTSLAQRHSAKMGGKDRPPLNNTIPPSSTPRFSSKTKTFRDMPLILWNCFPSGLAGPLKPSLPNSLATNFREFTFVLYTASSRNLSIDFHAAPPNQRPAKPLLIDNAKLSAAAHPCPPSLETPPVALLHRRTDHILNNFRTTLSPPAQPNSGIFPKVGPDRDDVKFDHHPTTTPSRYVHPPKLPSQSLHSPFPTLY